MNHELLFSLKSPFRDEFRIHGFRFGSGRKSCAIVGAMRGDEVEQQYVCSLLVRELKLIEGNGGITPGHEILVVPSANHFSMNIGKRFWAMDNTDLNRMFPGYDKGETTQRIAAALFKEIQGYEFGVQFASFYLSGDFIPHVRLMRTGYEKLDKAGLFGLPYVYMREPKPYDTCILNYNWQLWETAAYSLYCGQTSTLDEHSAVLAVRAVLRFLDANGIITCQTHPGYQSQFIRQDELQTVKAGKAGILFRMCRPDDHVLRGQPLARVLDPYNGTILWEATSPCDGTVFFLHNRPLALENDVMMRIIPDVRAESF